MRIVVLDSYTLNPGDMPLDMLAQFGELVTYDRTRSNEFFDRAASADILITNKTPIRTEHFAHLPQLKFIGILATGYDVVDVAAARRHGVAVSNIPAYGTNDVAQHTISLLLELTNHVGIHSMSVHSGDWSAAPDWCYWKAPLVALDGLKLGVVGFGRIGQKVARIAQALGMNILYSSRELRDGVVPGAQHCSTEELFAKSDVVSLHCSLTPETRGFVNGALLARMKPSAFLVNTARGALIHEVDLADALNHERLAGAAVDVLAQEPPPLGHPLLTARNCVLTPHIAWSSRASRKRILQMTADNIRAFLADNPIHLVN